LKITFFSKFFFSFKDSFGQEAVDTLVAEMENNRKRLVVIMAGYTKEMGEFMRHEILKSLNQNPEA
jgi:hypothetical protein